MSADTLPAPRLPFSCYGSYLSIMDAPGGPRAPGGPGVPGATSKAPPRLGWGTYLRSCRARGVGAPNVCRLDLLGPTGEVLPCDRHMTASTLTLTAKDGSGHAVWVFESADVMRVRVQGVSLKLTPEPAFVVVYQQDAARWVLNVRPALLRLGLEALTGELVVSGAWEVEQSTGASVTLHPDAAAGEGELRLTTFQSTWLIDEHVEPFDAVRREAMQRFDAWLDGTPAVADTALQDARVEAAYVNWASTVHPYGLLTRDAMFMSKVVMEQVWSWDNCFNAAALSLGDARQQALAWDQLMLVLEHQDGHGAFPDGLNPLFKHYNFSKPPVQGWTLDLIRRLQPTMLTRERMREIEPILSRWADWWLTHRRMPGYTLPHYLHGNDSGWDNSTQFDAGVPLVAPDLAAFLVTQFDALAWLRNESGNATGAADARRTADTLLHAMLDELWTGDRFIARVGVEGAAVKSDSLIPLIPLVLGERLPQDVQAKLIAAMPAFVTDWGPATEKPTSGKYSLAYWRGPIWAPSTMLLVDGLSRCSVPGATDLARDIAGRFCRLCAKAGFAENFDAIEGVGLCDPAYTWTSSVFLLLASRYFG